MYYIGIGSEGEGGRGRQEGVGKVRESVASPKSPRAMHGKKKQRYTQTKFASCIPIRLECREMMQRWWYTDIYSSVQLHIHVLSVKTTCMGEYQNKKNIIIYKSMYIERLSKTTVG